MPGATTSTIINTFLVQPRIKNAAPVLLSLNAQPKSISSAGRLFVMCTTTATKPKLKNQLQIFISQIMRHYYEEEALSRSYSLTPSRPETENCLEKTLEWANQLVNQVFDEELRPHLHFLIGCLKDKHVDFAVAGQISAFIIFALPGKNDYRLLDLLKDVSAPETSPDKEPFFSSLVSGDLQTNNFLIFSASAVFDFLTPDRFKKILLSRPPEEAALYLEKTLSEISSNLSFGGLIISCLPQAKILTKSLSSTKITPDSSIRRLIRKEQETEKILSSSLWLNLKDIGKRLWPVKEKKQELETIKKITKIYNRLTGWQGKIKNLWPLPINWKIYPPLKTMPKLKFFSLLAAAGLVLILLVSLGFSACQNQLRLEQEKYNQLMNAVKEKLDLIESKIIYKNEDDARGLIKQVQNDLANFPQNSQKRREMYQQFVSGLETLAVKLRRVENVSPTLLVDLGLINPNLQAARLLKSNQSGFFLWEPGGKELLWYNGENKKLAVLSSPLATELKDAARSTNLELLLLAGRHLVALDTKSQTFSTRESTWPKENSEIKLISFYNGRLYALDVKNQQIIKNSPSASGFAKGAFWLKEAIRLDDSSSMAIDGAIYLSKNNGEIWKLENGRRVNFNLLDLDPSLQSATKLFTTPDSTDLFILDPSAKRIIRWNKKTNKLISQYLSPEFDDMKDFSVEEKNKTIYILNDKKILNIKY